jgi:2-polyprenyl-3-methyl-5-hydroxy-6-metoxy-1,4-benzoquinol methylase
MGCTVDSLEFQSADSQQKRWKSEAEFFDEWAAGAARHLSATDPLAIRRYSHQLRGKFNKEFRFHLMGSLRGKSLLDVGCGDGSNGVMLAKMGAVVTGVDISPKAIDLAWKRADLDGVKDRVQFCCAPLETVEFPPNSFDIIWGDAILHHLIEDLDNLVRRMTEWARPGALLLFAEPVNFNDALRMIRFLLPVRSDATPGERPLEPAEIEIVRRHIPDLQVKPFTLLGRLNRFILPTGNYERSSWPRRAASNSLASLDYLLLSLPGIDRLGGTAVMHGHPRKQ